MTLKIRLAIVFVILGFVGCEHSRVTFGGLPDTKYHKTQQSLTKYERLYGLDKSLYETYVTYNSSELAEQYVEEYARIFSLNDFKKEAMLAEARSNQEKYDEFIIAHYASEDDNQQLTLQDPARVVWKLFLRTSEGNNGLIEATEINNVQLGTQKRYFYPHLSEWSKLYRVRFPKTASPDKHLVMKGTIKELTFDWK